MSKIISLFFFHLLLFQSFFKYLFALESCGIFTPPKNKESCFMNDLNEDERCCYLKSTIDNEYYCKKLNASVRNGNIKISSITDISCPEKYDDDLPGAKCDGADKIEPSDTGCKNLTKSPSHPCCYYHNGNVSKCFSIGKVDSSVLYTYDTNIIDCLSKYHKINYAVYFFIIIIFIYL